MQQRGDHRRTPETPMEKLFGVDYRTVESEYKEVISLLQTEEERKTRTRSRFSRFGSDAYGQRGHYGNGRRSSTGNQNSSNSSGGGGGGGGSPQASRSQRRNSYQRSESSSRGKQQQRTHTSNTYGNGNSSRRNASSSSSSSRQNNDHNAYAVLGVDRSASGATIKKAFHKLALKYHPDKVKNKPPGGTEDPAAVFKRINEAYSKLKDPASKRQYDVEIGRSRRSSW